MRLYLSPPSYTGSRTYSLHDGVGLGVQAILQNRQSTRGTAPACGVDRPFVLSFANAFKFESGCRAKCKMRKASRSLYEKRIELRPCRRHSVGALFRVWSGTKPHVAHPGRVDCGTHTVH
jgi:hypothetical protein